MNDKNRFQEMLGDILEIARTQENKLSMQEIRTLFGDTELSDIQYEHIFAYLAANHIKIEGYLESISEYTRAVRQEERSAEEANASEEEWKEESDEKLLQEAESAKQKEEDSVYLKMYLEDLEAIADCSPKEEQELIDKILEGDSYARTRFIEANLYYVVQIAGEYKNKGITLEDLIQEGNIGLLSSIEYLSELEQKDKWKEFIADYVRRFIEAAIGEQNDSSSFENKIVEKIKYINDAANELAADLGREADIHELAASTKLSEEEVQDILNMSTDAVKISPHNHEAEDHSGNDHHHHGEHNHDHHHSES